MNNIQDTDYPNFSVRKFYEGKNILLTGCTGFVGKVILEKVLRCCPVNKVFILMRAKRNKQPIDRLKKDIFESYLFSVLRRKHPDFNSFI